MQPSEREGCCGAVGSVLLGLTGVKAKLSPRRGSCSQQWALSCCMITHRHVHTSMYSSSRKTEEVRNSWIFHYICSQAFVPSWMGKWGYIREEPAHTLLSNKRDIWLCCHLWTVIHMIKKSWQIIRMLCCKFGWLVGASTAGAAYSGRDLRNRAGSSSKSSFFPLLRQHVWHNWQLISPALRCELPLNASLVLGLVLN